jgi:hypothetical protein
MIRDDPSFDTIFSSAIEIASGEERAAFVARACGADDELRHRVERLVAAHFQAGSFLESPPASPTASMALAASTELSGTAIGPYKEIAPGDGMIWNTLGVAHYRAGEWHAAVEALEKSNDLLGGKELGFNAFFLAMAHWQLGEKQAVRGWFDKAVSWMEKNRPKDEDLVRFRAEAAALLEVNETKH